MPKQRKRSSGRSSAGAADVPAIAEPVPQPHSARLYVLLTIAAVLFCVPLFSRLDYHGRSDWDQYTFRYETPRVALLRDHQLPFWNPYVNGGTVLLAHPHCPVLSPWYLIVLVLGGPLGLRVQVLLFMVAGATGMAALMGRWGALSPGRFVAGIVYQMSGFYVLHVADGHLSYCVMGLMPWLLLCLIQLGSSHRFLVLGGLLLGSVLTFGTVYMLAVFAPFFSIWALLESVRTRKWCFAAGWVGVVAITVLLSAAKLLPQLQFVEANPRETAAEGFSPRGLFYVFLDARQAFLYRATQDAFLLPTHADFKRLPDEVSKSTVESLGDLGFSWQWQEYSGYITHLGLALALWGMVVSWRSRWPLYVAGLSAANTVLGNGSPFDTWAMLHQLPFYQSLHVPSRFLAVVVFTLAVAAGYGLDSFTRRVAVTKRAGLYLLVHGVIPAAIYVELAAMGWTIFSDVFVVPPRPVSVQRDFAVRYARGNLFYLPVMRSDLCVHLRSNSGVLIEYENVAVPRGDVRTADDPNYRGEVFLEPERGSATIDRWTMSRVEVSCQVDAPTTLSLNQNYYDGWRAIVHGKSGSRKLATEPSPGGLVSVVVRPGENQVEFYYVPKSFYWGTAVSVMTLAGCLVLLLKPRRAGGNGGGRPFEQPTASSGKQNPGAKTGQRKRGAK